MKQIMIKGHCIIGLNYTQNNFKEAGDYCVLKKAVEVLNVMNFTQKNGKLTMIILNG